MRSQPAAPDIDTGARGFGSERLLACLAAALLWALPHAFGSGRAGSWAAYVALAGAGSFTLALLALSLDVRGLDASLRRTLAQLTLGCGLALVPWAALVFGLLLKTHHRPLGAVTFAAGAAACGCAGWLVAVWAFRRRDSGARGGRTVLAALMLLASLGAFALIAVAARSVLREPALASAAVDLGAGAVLFAAVLLVPAGRWAVRTGRAGLVACLVLWGATFWLVRADAEVRATVKSAPVLSGVVGLAAR